MAIALTEYFQAQRQAYDKVCHLWYQTPAFGGGGGVFNYFRLLRFLMYML